MAKFNVGFIDGNGHYHRGYDNPLPNQVNFTYKEYDHDMQRKEFSREIIQPYIHGKPNRAFIESYPVYSRKYFNQEIIDQTLRELL